MDAAVPLRQDIATRLTRRASLAPTFAEILLEGAREIEFLREKVARLEAKSRDMKQTLDFLAEVAEINRRVDTSE